MHFKHLLDLAGSAFGKTARRQRFPLQLNEGGNPRVRRFILGALIAGLVLSALVAQLPAAAAAIIFSDSFDDGTRDASKWNLGVLSRNSSWVDPQVQVAEQSGRLSIYPRASMTGFHYNGYVSVPTLNLTGALAAVELVQKAADKTNTSFSVGTDSANWYGFRATGTTLYIESRLAGTTSSIGITYSATQHRFLRVRHNPANDSIVFETSADGATWTARRTVARQFAITAVKAELVAGTSVAISAPGTALFDNFHFDSNTVTPTPTPVPSPTPTPTPTPTPAPSPSPTPSPTPTSGKGQMFISTTELMAKPTSGAGWTFLKSKADSTWGTVRLSDQTLLTQGYVLAGALVYARTGDATYRNKVIAAIKQVPGTEVGTTTQLLALARTLYGYVVSADMVGMDYSTVCNNGETWQNFLERIRTTVIPGNSRWTTLEYTSGNSANNWGIYALSSHLAVSYALNDTAAIQRDTDIFKRFLGDLSSPAAPFQPTASYNFNNDGPTWDMSPTMLRGINPATPADPRNGALIEDSLRDTSGGSDSVPCCTVQPAAVGYQEEALDGILSTAQLLRAHGVDMTTSQSSALKRAFAFYITHGGPGPYSLSRYLPYAINYLYGTTYPTQTEDRPYRHMGYGSWLFTGTR